MASGSSVLSRFRLTGLTVIVGVGLVGILFYGLFNSHYLGTIIVRSLGPYSDALAEHIFDNSDPERLRLMAMRHGVIILVAPAHGDTIAFNSKGERLSPDAPELEKAQLQSVRTSADGTRVTFYWTLWSFWGGQLPLLLGLLALIVGVVGSAFLFLQRQLRPLAWLQSGVEAVAQGNLQTRVPVVRDDEIGRVAEAFNVMTGRVGEMIDDRERLLADVSHELRSPIARMKVALEFVPEGDKRDALARDLREMQGLIDVLLEREAMRSRAARRELKSVDLGVIAADVVASFAAQGPGVEFEPIGDATVEGDPALLKLLLQNLVDNAIKFSSPDSAPVSVKLEAHGDKVTLRVADDGIGIPAGSEERIFEPFVKMDRARGHRVGYGLGLNLCQRIAQVHGGMIKLESREPRGAEAVVELLRRSSGLISTARVSSP
ncbi:MAG: HAMP domain-containing sensor histidine kinase [Thermoanaerobaculia bacterium]|jgi:signal transduction histidine kinase